MTSCGETIKRAAPLFARNPQGDLRCVDYGVHAGPAEHGQSVDFRGV
jgi:hypothetical protein